MSKARLVITAVTVEKRPVAQVVADYGVSRSWVYELLVRYRAEGAAAFQPRSRAAHTHPTATADQTVQLVLELRKTLAEQGLDAGADTIGWHLRHHHGRVVSRATIHRILTRAGAVVPEPAKRPKSSYIRFEAEQPNQCWQSDFTHYRLTKPGGTPGRDTEIITWLDDHSRYALHVSVHERITASIVHATFIRTGQQYGFPASTLTDNGMVYTVRFAGGKGGRTKFEAELRARNIQQKNGQPNHPQTQGKVERFQQTMKNWLHAQPTQPDTISTLQALLDAFRDEYNQRRPHRSLHHQATPATAYDGPGARPKAAPSTDRTTDSHDRVRHDRIDSSGVLTLRVNGRLHHIGIGRTHARTPVIMLVHDLTVRVVHAATGELLRELTIDPQRDYQPLDLPPGPRPKPKNARTHNP